MGPKNGHGRKKTVGERRKKKITQTQKGPKTAGFEKNPQADLTEERDGVPCHHPKKKKKGEPKQTSGKAGATIRAGEKKKRG